MAFSLRMSEQNIWVGKFSLFPEDIATHGISTRLGGVSKPPFESLNLALHVGDEPAAVGENRRRFCRALGLSEERLCTAEQVHGERIVRVTAAEAGRGARAYADAIAGTDALMTDVPGIPLLLCYADCMPVLLLDPVHKAAAVVHAGWKGTALGIAGKTVRAMQAAFGTRPEDCLAAIAPAIGASCYEIGEDVAAKFQAAFPAFGEKIVRRVSGRPHLDLWQANYRQLEAAGLLSRHIEIAAVCTACNTGLFFSYRAEKGTTGRIGAMIALK